MLKNSKFVFTLVGLTHRKTPKILAIYYSYILFDILGPNCVISCKFQADLSHTGLSLTHKSLTERFQEQVYLNRCQRERLLTSRYHKTAYWHTDLSEFMFQKLKLYRNWSCTDFRFTARKFLQANLEGKYQPWILRLSLGRVWSLQLNFSQASPHLNSLQFLNPKVWQTEEKP